MQIVKFGADWCGPCKAIDPILDALPDDIPVVRYDVDLSPELSTSWGVRSVPTTFIVSDSGEVLDYKVGTYSRQQLETWIDAFRF